MEAPKQGTLVVIGGHEDREGDRTILRAVAERLDGRSLLLVTAASRAPEEYVDTYTAAFRDLGVEVVPVDASGAGGEFGDAGGLFISGGDQNRMMEDASPQLKEAIRALFAGGGVIAGTSAGASVLSDVMLSRGPGEQSPAPGEVKLSTGLGLIGGAIVDQHFAERGRIGRLAAAIAQRPELTGIGIDEDTAAIIQNGRLGALGAGSVYVLDLDGNADEDAREGHPREYRLRLLMSGDSIELPSSVSTEGADGSSSSTTPRP